MEAVVRKACRGILLTPEREILLLKVDGTLFGGWSGWVAPGGGMAEGETEDEAFARELSEELGYTLRARAEKLWTRFHRFPWDGKIYEQFEVFFLVRTHKFDPSVGGALTAAEKSYMTEKRWWRIEDLKSTTDEYSPRKLHDLVEQILKDGPPEEPFEISI